VAQRFDFANAGFPTCIDRQARVIPNGRRPEGPNGSMRCECHRATHKPDRCTISGSHTAAALLISQNPSSPCASQDESVALTADRAETPGVQCSDNHSCWPTARP